MTTPRAILFATAALCLTALVCTFYGVPRFSMTNAGSGITMRLDRRSGDVMGCAWRHCAPVIENGKAQAVKDAAAPPPPPGFAITNES